MSHLRKPYVKPEMKVLEMKGAPRLLSGSDACGDNPYWKDTHCGEDDGYWKDV